MTVMLVGGGTGGHILPLLAVAASLRSKQPKVKIFATVDTSTKFAYLLENSKLIDDVYKVRAGKYRRYANQSFIESLLDLKTIALNIRDIFRTFYGLIQSIYLIRRLKPDVIFIKGGFVAVPVGLASRFNKVPFITHDSDASPGLANKIIGRWAKLHLVGMDKSNYDYPADKTVEVGIPVNSQFVTVTPKLKQSYRQQIGIGKDTKLVLVVGGSQGSKNLNKIVAKISRDLISDSKLCVIHQVGGKHAINLPRNTKQYKVMDYISNLHLYSGAADVIVSRAGSVLAEFAAQGKAVIVVPAPHLAGDHQSKNAKLLSRRGAVVALEESELINRPQILLNAIDELLNDKIRQQELGQKLNSFYKPGAAQSIADEIVKLNKKVQ